jgi:hypothetical protein
MAETWIQAYARTSVIQALRRLQNGRLTVTITYQEENNVETFGENTPEAADNVALAVHNPNVWGRLAQAFALVSVRRKSLCTASWTLIYTLCRAFQRRTCIKK